MSILSGPQPTGEGRIVSRELPFEPIPARQQRSIWDAHPHVEVNGYKLVQYPGLKYDEVRPDPTSRVALVGELRHVLYMDDMRRLKQSVRLLMQSDLRAIVEACEKRLGLHTD